MSFARLKQAKLDQLAAQFEKALAEGIIAPPESQDLAQFVLMFQDNPQNEEMLDVFFRTIARKWPDFGQYAGLPGAQGAVQTQRASGASASARFCPQCGTKLESDWQFCMSCGHKLR